MTNNEINSVLFRGVIANLNELVDENNNRLGVDTGLPHSFYVLWQTRQNMTFRHNYERDRYLKKRDKYIAIESGSKIRIVVRETKTGEVTIYRNTLKALFPDDYIRMVKILEKLLRKFYSYVTVENYLNERYADMSNTNNPHDLSITYEV